MALSIDLVLIVIGLVLFALATFSVPTHPRLNLIAAGLFCWLLTLLV
jgi:hypothetical protein